ncbi:MAG: hypothetical protein GY839_00760 [candidate division Zixibacteria bacterium]|nr:hypothetical protein [candidate division Zixibacteria bacterium]
MLSTEPLIHPIKIDYYVNSIFFENGDLVLSDYRNDILSTFSLNSICSDNDIKDIIYYDEYLGRRNNSVDIYDIDSISHDEFKLVLSNTACYRLDDSWDLELTFGNTGPDNEKLNNAIAADIDVYGRVYIADAGDNSIKIYNEEGEFITSWSDIGSPRKIKLFDDKVYILDSENDNIVKYTQDGDLIGNAIVSNTLQNITAFSIVNPGLFLVADLNGRRITFISSSGVIDEEKFDYCFYDIEFAFEDIRFVDYPDSWHAPFIVVDYGSNTVIEFYGGYYFCHFM